jgi:hypothetical protein
MNYSSFTGLAYVYLFRQVVSNITGGNEDRRWYLFGYIALSVNGRLHLANGCSYPSTASSAYPSSASFSSSICQPKPPYPTVGTQRLSFPAIRTKRIVSRDACNNAIIAATPKWSCCSPWTGSLDGDAAPVGTNSEVGFCDPANYEINQIILEVLMKSWSEVLVMLIKVDWRRWREWREMQNEA